MKAVKNDYLQDLLLSEPIRRPVLETALGSLNLPEGSRGLDVGCGPGLGTRILAHIIGPRGQVVGLDYNPEFIQGARVLSDCSIGTAATDYQVGDACRLSWDDNAFDWACSIDFIGYGGPDIHTLLGELVRVIKPGGMAAIMAWSSQILLPGYPKLEAGLNATKAGMAPFQDHMQPEQHFLRSRRCFHRLGLNQTEVRTYAGWVNAPLSGDIRDALSSLLRMRWGSSREEIGHELWGAYQQICDPESPDFILNLPEYHGFFTYTLIQARVL